MAGRILIFILPVECAAAAPILTYQRKNPEIERHITISTKTTACVAPYRTIDTLPSHLYGPIPGIEC